MEIIENKFYTEESVFKAENLLREARRQKDINPCSIPSVCLLDPDGDILAYLQKTEQAELNSCWACYHTKLYSFKLGGIEIGVIACAVGASFAVLVAEQAFASGCEYLVSITSSGIINAPAPGVEYIIIDEAIRDEGTSYHYLPPGELAVINPQLKNVFRQSDIFRNGKLSIGKSWTTDAPYRETASAIATMQQKNVGVVEMEAAALYAFAKAKDKKVVCVAHITNTMAQTENDFEKGAENGSLSSLNLLKAITSLLPVTAEF